jgi:hypothetical protein
MYQFIFGLLIGVFSLGASIDISPTSYYNIVNTALKECEKSLPRDQHCKIIAIPIAKD